MTSALLAAALLQQNLNQVQLESALKANSAARITPLFSDPTEAAKLVRMGGRNLRDLDVFVIPAPAGWEQNGSRWAVFSKFQHIQQDHDLVFTINGSKLGEEVPEYELGGYSITHLNLDSKLHPADHMVEVVSELKLDAEAGSKSVVARLNAPYAINAAWVDGKPAAIAGPDEVPNQQPYVMKAGGVVIVNSNQTVKSLRLAYSGVINTRGHDKITTELAHVTAWWTPSIGRLSHTTESAIVGPSSWVIRGEGFEKEKLSFTSAFQSGRGEKQVFYKCDIPISYPKILAGTYTLAHEVIKDGRAYRSWQINPVDKKRAQTDVRIMMDAMAFFEKNLTPFPFDRYEVFDADTYYGIESYSHTLLRRNVTTRFVAHELGHTWFGGIAPSAYTKDTWNEGMTQYIDSVAFGGNRDRSLNNGLRTLSYKKPLSKLLGWEAGNASYMRGAYVLNMLAEEIGQENVFKGMRLILEDRVGKETLWPDLREYFEQASGEELKWFWDQWVTGAEFPQFGITAVQRLKGGGHNVAIRQTGSAKPLRARIAVIWDRVGGVGPVKEVVTLTQRQQTFAFSGTPEGQPRLEVFPYTLGTVKK